MFGPDPLLPLPLKFKRTKTPRKKVKSRAKAEKTRVSQRPERQKEESRRRAERLLRRANKREEEQKSRAERGELEVTKAKKSVWKGSHGTEEVDAIILKVLGRSQKSKKVVQKSRAKKVESPEVAGPKWRHGMQEERHEGRTLAKTRRKQLKASQVSPSSGNLDKAKSLEERQPKAGVGQVLSMVEVGPDYQADGGHFSNGDGAEALVWPLGPDYAELSNGEEMAELASPLPAKNPLDPETFCLKFYQVRKELFMCFIQKNRWCIVSFVIVTNIPNL